MIYIVRHGNTDWNALGKVQGITDIPLNDIGINQAKEVKKKLKDIKFDYVFSSPLARAITTAKIITDHDIIIDNRLIERNNGKFEGLDQEQIRSIKSKPDFDEKDYGLESNEELQKRADSFMSEILKKYPGKNILVVCHAGIIINIRCFLDGIPDDIRDYFFDNCEVYKYKN